MKKHIHTSLQYTVLGLITALCSSAISLFSYQLYDTAYALRWVLDGSYSIPVQHGVHTPDDFEGRLFSIDESLAGQNLHSAPPAKRIERKPNGVVGMYLTPNSMSRTDFMIDTMQRTGAAGGNALVFDVKGSAVFFNSDSLPIAHELGLVQERYDLEEVLRIAKERGIYTIGRFIAVKDAGFTRKRPDTMITHPDTGRVIGYEYIDPENADALAYNREAICALAAMGMDEINLDYIRFSTEQYGVLYAYSPEEKARKIESFIRMAREAIDDCGSSTALGISTFAILGWNYEQNVATLGQDVIRFAPLVDIISPMAYPATFAVGAYYSPGRDPGSRMYYLVWRTLEGYKELLGPEHSKKLRPWIQGYGITRKNAIDQMKAVADAGVCGFTVWNADNAYATAYAALPSFERPTWCVE